MLSVLKENRPYELRDVKGKPSTWEGARKLVQLNYKVPEEIKRDRRWRKNLGNSSQKTSRKRREMVNA